MADTTRKGWSLFAAGLMVGGAAALWASFAWLLPAMGPALPDGGAKAEAPPAEPAARLTPLEPATASRVATGVRPSEAACQFEPLLRRAGRRDGRFTAGAATADDAAQLRGYLAAARDATRQGRTRDSEVALLVACRLAASRSPRVSVPVADVQSLLAQRYLEAAEAEHDAGARAQMLERAEGLLEQSLLSYTLVLGADASKSRVAARRIAVLGQLRDREALLAVWAGGDVIAPASGELPPAAALATLGASGQPPWTGLVPPATAADARPAIDVAALIRADPELMQADADLGRLREQAASVSKDPQGLRDRASRALVQRNAQCRDKACLLQWYAKRRRELFAEF